MPYDSSKLTLGVEMERGRTWKVAHVDNPTSEFIVKKFAFAEANQNSKFMRRELSAFQLPRHPHVIVSLVSQCFSFAESEFGGNCVRCRRFSKGSLSQIRVATT